MKKHLVIIIVMVLAVMTVFTVMPGAVAEDEKAAEPVKKISFEQAAINLFCNDPLKSQYVLQPVFEPAGAAYDDLTFVSSNEKVVTADADGKLTALNPGKAKITVTAYTGNNRKAVRAAVTVTVVSGITALEDGQTEITVAVGKSIKVSPNVIPEDATNKKLIWKTDDENIAKADARGNVRGIQPGNCTVTAIAQDGSGTEIRYSVTVIQPVTAVKKDSKKTKEIYTTVNQNIYEECMGRFTVMPANATNPVLKLTIIRDLLGIKMDYPGGYTLEEGSLVFREPGLYIVTATSTDGSNKSASCKVRVAPEDIRDALLVYRMLYQYESDGNICVGFSIINGECGWPVKSVRLFVKAYITEEEEYIKEEDNDKPKKNPTYSILSTKAIQPGKQINTNFWVLHHSQQVMKIGVCITEVEFDDGTVVTLDNNTLCVFNLREEDEKEDNPEGTGDDYQ